MDVYEAIRTRRSIRAYSDKPIPDDSLRRVLDAARLAPSAKNRQEWRFIVVKDAVQRKKLAETTKEKPFVGAAPVVLAFCATETLYEMPNGLKGGIVDVSIALSYLTLAARAEGLGTCWIGAFFEEKAREVLGLPAGARVIALCPIGYPAENPPARDRKRFEEVVGYDRW